MPVDTRTSRKWGTRSLMACSAFLLEGVPVTAEAQEHKQRTLAPINVESTIPSEVELTPGAATQITDEEIDTYRPYTLHDALNFAPGVRTIYDDVLGRRSGIAVRGAPSRRSRKTLLLEDGVPINASTYIDPSAHYTPPLERLESVDVLKGAGHILHGPLNNHGIINFVNKQPTATPETTIEAGFGNLGTFKRHAMHTRTTGPVGLVFAYTGMDAEGSFDVEQFQYDDFFTSADWAINNSHDLGFSFTYFRERSNYDESNLAPVEYERAPRNKNDRGVPPGQGPGPFRQDLNNFSINYFKYDLVHDWQATDNLAISTRMFHTDLERPRFTVEPDEIAVDPLPIWDYADDAFRFQPGVSGVMIGRDRTYKTYGLENRMRLSGVRALGAMHIFEWGVRYEDHDFTNREPVGRTGEILDESNRGRVGVGISEPTTGEAPSLTTYDAEAVSGFIKDSILVGNWTIAPGVRVENYTVGKNAVIEDGMAIGERQEDENTLVLPAINVLYDGFEHTQWFGNVGRGFTPAFARTADSFPLEPETGINSQVGFRTSAVRGLRAEGAVFYNVITDTVVQTRVTINNRNLVVNAEDSISYGFDLGARFDSAARTGSDLNIFGELAYGYVRAEFTEGEFDGNRVPEVPENVGSLTLGLSHTLGWEISATVSYFDGFFTDVANTRDYTLANEDFEPVGPGDSIEIREPAVLGEVPDHTLLSARASYTFPNSAPRTTLWIQGRNLTDKLYVVDTNNGLRPGPKRTVIVGLTSKFE